MKQLSVAFAAVVVATATTACSPCGLTGQCGDPPARVVQQQLLNIFPVVQTEPDWCWIATGEMIFRHFGMPSVSPSGDYQCGIVGALNPLCGFACDECIVNGQTIATIDFLLRRYPIEVRARGGQAPNLLTTVLLDTLPAQAIIDHIDAGSPVIAGISPDGFRLGYITEEHVALVVGYQFYSDQSFWLIVNDPWPYADAVFEGRTNPYLDAGGHIRRSGQYEVPLSGFHERFSWSTTIHDLRTGT